MRREGKYYTPSKLSENISITPEGYLICHDVPITRTGELIYGEGETPLETDAEGKVIIYRDSDSVFHVDTIASFEGKPVTLNHPEDFVSPDNWSYLAKGTVQNVRRGIGGDGQNLIADLLITDKQAIQLVQNGLREVSCGYEAEYSQTAKGKGRQTNIIGNHVALVQKGRAGATCAIYDHERKATKMSKMKEKFLSVFAKSFDEAMKDEDTKEDKKEAKDEGAESGSMSEVLAALKALTEKVEAMSGEKKADAPPAVDEKKEEPKADAPKPEEKSKDEGEESAPAAEPTMEERMKAIETAIATILDKLSGDDEDESDEDDSEESEDEKSDEDKEESKDEDSKKEKYTSDAISRAEILAPGIEQTKDMKAQALKAAYATADGKKVIETLTGGKAPAFDSAEKVESLFIGASELLKAKRSEQWRTKLKTSDHDDSSVMTPAKLNELNKSHYGLK